MSRMLRHACLCVMRHTCLSAPARMQNFAHERGGISGVYRMLSLLCQCAKWLSSMRRACTWRIVRLLALSLGRCDRSRQVLGVSPISPTLPRAPLPRPPAIGGGAAPGLLAGLPCCGSAPPPPPLSSPSPLHRTTVLGGGAGSGLPAQAGVTCVAARGELNLRGAHG